MGKDEEKDSLDSRLYGENDGLGEMTKTTAHVMHFLPSVILGASPGIQAIILRVVPFFLPAVILGASPGIQFLIRKHQPGFPPMRRE